MALPSTTRAWSIREINKDSFDSLLGDHDVLVQIEAVSLNYRDLAIPKGLYPFAINLPFVPGSDSAGIVLAVGPKVIRVAKGDRACTLFNEHHLTNPITPEAAESGFGGAIDGTLREYAVFGDHALVKAPTSLNAIEASTLTCAPLTAWNALYGLQSKAIKAGDWVLTQGTGGVSLSGIQVAAAAGATVKPGATHIINYKETPNWGEVARALTPEGAGFDHILEVSGAGSLEQSLKAIKLEGVITIIGFLAPSEKQPPLMDALKHVCIVRGIFVGSRQQFEEMNRAIDSAKIYPVIDSNIFSFDDVKKAYQYQWDQKHFGKVVIKIAN
ncbi:hypothetical protein M441DRAFT_81126 [Trichoderma asperellum CBS 433.97]|uniref:Enoyl reductase (ER) domain-containing protein n=1 Tax=Trichoderma asperellum (strain ATCC 204424 / CBS 433.97 / NBRC 101777) TaxID=1042311 RepID=A0A2T3Z6N6_TRIA4|nr:hypothetical protein M441DRAFT_81126 [Trichoderma asperellum CBS 433.97]PTB40420.1 hypothetical protein M441DRAFT_81126 [Trichoderma asperellum CBS 433.97]